MKGLTTPLLRWLRGFICLCRCEGLVRGLQLDWYLGSQKLREILTLLCCITLSSSRKTKASSRRSKKDFWHRCRGGLRSSQDIPSTHLPHIYIICHLPLVFLSPTSPLSFYLPSLSQSPLSLLLAFLFACVLDFLSRWRKIIPNCVTFPIPIITISLVLWLLLLIMLSLVKSMLLCWILLWKISSPAFLVKMPLLI